MKNITRTSLDDLVAAKERGEISPPRDDAKEIDLPDNFWANATVKEPRTKEQVNMRVDPDIMEFFKQDGKGHLTRMHAVLRSYVNAQRKQRSPS